MKGIRFGLRLLLLIVALCAVLFAWIGARRELRRTNLRGQIRGFEIQHDHAAGRTDDAEEGEFWKARVKENDAMIASLREQLGVSDR